MQFFPKNIRYFREKEGLSQVAFADKLGLTRASISAYEEGRADPPYSKLMALAAQFEITVDELCMQDMEEKVLYTLKHESQDVNELKAVSNESVQSATNDLRPFDEEQIKTEAPEYKENTKLQFDLFDGTKKDPDIRKMTLIPQDFILQYPAQFRNENFLQNLPEISLFNLPAGTYRAFECVAGFPVENATLITAYQSRWNDVIDNRAYVLLLRNLGLIYRKVFNQARTKGTMILSGEKSDVAVTEVALGDILEIWEVRQFISRDLPQPSPAMDRIADMVNQLKSELDRLSTGPGY